MPRLKEKLKLASEYCERIVCWGYQQYGRPALGEAAQDWHKEYEAWYKSVKT